MSTNFDRDSEIAKKYQESHTSCDLAILYGVSRSRIQQILKKAGLNREDGCWRKRGIRRKAEYYKSRAEYFQRRYQELVQQL